MSRKHFRAIAAALKANKPIMSAVSNRDVEASHDVHMQQWREMVESIATICGELNGEFKRSVFLDASGFNG